jgi:xanthine dehydrogenase small subunit
MAAAYHRPATLEDALAIRAGEPVTVLAGGTDVYPARAARVGWGDMRQPDILDISAVAGFRGITKDTNGWRIGALTTWTDLIRADLPPIFEGLKLAAHEVGGVQIQNRGTLAGNICTASPAGDGTPNLLALDAAVELASRQGRRVVPMAQFICGYRQTVCRPDEILTAILVPKPRGAVRSDFLKLGARKYLVISIVMVAGVIELDAAGAIGAAHIAVGACSAVPQRLPALEATLVGVPLTAAAEMAAGVYLEGLAPIDDIRGSANYRRQAALALVKDLLAELALPERRRAA